MYGVEGVVRKMKENNYCLLNIAFKDYLRTVVESFLGRKGVTSSIVIQVQYDCAEKNLFSELHSRMFDTSVEANPVHILVKTAASMYCQIHLHHLAKRETVTGALLRERISKLILFHHQ